MIVRFSIGKFPRRGMTRPGAVALVSVPVLIVSLRELEKAKMARSLEDFGSID